MEVRSGRSAGHSRRAQPLALGYGLAGQDIDAIEVAVHADQAVAVIDEDRPAVEEVVVNGKYRAVGIRPDGSAAWDGDVESGVRRAWLAIEESADAETPGQPPLRRQDEARVGIGGLAPVTLQALDGGNFTLDPRQVAGRQLNLAAVLHRDALFRVVPRADHEAHAVRFSGRLHAKLVRTGGSVEGEPGDGNPLAAIGGDQNLLLAEPGTRLAVAGG